MIAAPQLSVVIPCHNGAATLADQLAALAAQGAATAFEVLVVDNRSTDQSAAVALGFTDRLDLRVVSATDGASVAYARNTGACAARAAKVAFCDADDLVRQGWVDAMAEGLDVDDVVGGVADVRRVNSADARRWVGHPPLDALPTTMKYRPYAIGSCLGIRRSVWESLGGFDEDFVGGHEEVDLCWRAADAGHTLGFAPGAVIDYRLREDRRGLLRQRTAYGRTYAQLYAKFRDHPIPRSSVRHEVRVVAHILADVWPEWRRGNLTGWLAGMAWTWGRYRGDLAYRVRCPL